MSQIVFTVDVDRDVAWPKNGSHAAGSKHSVHPRFEASKAGFFALLEMVERLGISATFFFEAETARRINVGANDVQSHEVACHGLDHEDFTGKKTFSPVLPQKRRAILQKAKAMLENQFGCSVTGFRAPYLHWDAALLEMLGQNGFTYDSSLVFGELERPPLPELFLPRWTDGAQKPLSGYLWRLMEGTRTPGDYLQAVADAVGREEPYVVLATHSWHTHASVEKGALAEKAVSANLANLEAVLAGVKDMPGADFVMAREAARKV